MVKQNGRCKEAVRRVPSCFGFRVRSDFPLQFLRAGGGNGVLEIRVEDGTPAPQALPMLEWKLQGSGREIVAKLFTHERGYQYWISDTGWYRIEPAGRVIWIPQNGGEVYREHRLWGVPAVLCAIHQGDFFLHAAAVEVNGGAVLLAAPGRHGKTTLALAFHRLGYRVLSEDSACCRLAAAPVLLPGPAILRIRPDMFDRRALVGTQLVSEDDDRIYLSLNEDQRGSDDPVPIKAIVFLRQSTDQIYLERVAAQRAIPDLWSLNFHLPQDAARAQSFRQLTGLVGRIPIWNLHRPLQVARLEETVARIVKIAG